MSRAGHALSRSPPGALYWEAEDTLLVADLHLEKGAAFAALRHAAAALRHAHHARAARQACIDALQPAHASWRSATASTGASSRPTLAAEDARHCSALQQGREWYWISGNHDPDLPASIGGTVCRTLTIGGVTLRHEPLARPLGARSPAICTRWRASPARAKSVRRRCFATDGQRLVMPAFGAYAGGLNVLDEAFALALPAAATRGLADGPRRRLSGARQPAASRLSLLAAEGEPAEQARRIVAISTASSP